MEREVRKEKKNSIYRVVITEIDPESGETKELMDDKFTAIDMVADDYETEGAMCEIMLNDNIHGAAMKLANAHKLRSAVRVANAFLLMQDDNKSMMENLLADALSEGGVQ